MSVLQRGCPELGASRNQTSSSFEPGSVKVQKWAPGDEQHPEQWGLLVFDEAPPPVPNVPVEDTVTIQTAAGAAITLRAGNNATATNGWPGEAITQSNWNDWDPIDYTIKELIQFELSSIPAGRRIISAKLQNRCKGNFNSGAQPLYLHVLRLADSYNPATVTMLTSPLPIENSARQLVQTSDPGSWVEFDVTDLVIKAYAEGASVLPVALGGSSGDIHNGKIWDAASNRPKLVVSYGAP